MFNKELNSDMNKALTIIIKLMIRYESILHDSH